MATSDQAARTVLAAVRDRTDKIKAIEYADPGSGATRVRGHRATAGARP
ncbi:hypothetical protein [Micromonospora sp. NBC_00617]